jgi:hypothetical protein
MSEIIENKLLSLLLEFHGKIPNERYDNTKDLIVHNEGVIAFENLCDNLFEYAVPIQSTTFFKIKSLAEQMHVSPKRWSFLEKNLIEPNAG